MHKYKTDDLETKLIILNRVGYRTFLKQTAHLIDFLEKRLDCFVVIATWDDVNVLMSTTVNFDQKEKNYKDLFDSLLQKKK